MQKQSLSLPISPAIGAVSAEILAPEKSTCIFTLAHGAGAGMQHVFMVELCEALATLGIATLRFNFPFMENKKGRPDSPAVAHLTIQAAILQAQALFPSIPLFVAGKSFGGRMSSQLLAAQPNANVKGLIFYGFPLHPSGKPSIDRAEHLKQVELPMLFLQGTKDTLATLDLIVGVCASLPKATLVKIEGADHGFKAGKRNVIEELGEATSEWAARLKG